jgi:5'-methylthioadenosine phosphorylase
MLLPASASVGALGATVSRLKLTLWVVLGLPAASVAMVTDYDCWRDGEAVDVAQVVQQMQANGALARAMVANFIAALPKSRDPSPIDTALDDAVITSADEHDPAVMAQLDAVAGRLFG